MLNLNNGSDRCKEKMKRGEICLSLTRSFFLGSITMRLSILILLLTLYGSSSLFSQNEIAETIVRMKEALKQQPDDPRRLKEISFLYLHQANYDEAIVWADKLLRLGRQSHDDDLLLYAHIALGQAYVMKGEREEAYANLHQGRMIAEREQNDSAFCSLYNGLGLYAANMERDYYRSIDYFFQGIEAAKRSGHEQLHNILLINISGIYYLKGDAVGLPYALEAYNRGHAVSNPYLIYAAATNAAYMYHLMGDDEEALQYIKEAEFLMKQNNFYDHTNVYALYGHILLAQEKVDEAISFFERALDEREQANTSSLVYALYGYAGAQQAMKEREKAIALLKEALVLTYQQNNPIHRDKIMEELSNCYHALSDYEQALQWRIRYQTESDSLFNADKERALGDLRMKYDSERQENQIREAEMVLWQKTKNEQLLILSLVAVLLVILFLLYLMWKRNRFYGTIISQYRTRIRNEKQLQEKLQRLEARVSQRAAELPGDQEKLEKLEKRYAVSSLTDEKRADLFSRLEKLMQEEKVYRDKLLTREKVADILGSNRTYLSQIINRQTSLSFTQYVHEYRINEVVRIMSDPNSTGSLKMISQNVGFSSMTTFYKAFQQVVGMTPTQYKNKMSGATELR